MNSPLMGSKFEKPQTKGTVTSLIGPLWCGTPIRPVLRLPGLLLGKINVYSELFIQEKKV